MDYQTAVERGNRHAQELSRLLDGFTLEGCELIVGPYIAEPCEGNYEGFATAAWKTRIDGKQYGYAHVTVGTGDHLTEADAAFAKNVLTAKLAETRRELAA